MKIPSLVVSVVVASAAFWLMTAVAPLSHTQHAQGVAKALNLDVPVNLKVAQGTACSAEYARLGKTMAGSDPAPQDQSKRTDMYCVPFRHADLQHLALALPGVLMRGPRASDFQQTQSKDGITMRVTLNVLPRSHVTAMLRQEKALLVLRYNRD